MGVMRYDNGNKVLFLHQSGSEGERFNFKAAVPVTVKLNSKGHIYDVREGKYLGFTDTFKSSILPAWSKVYSLQQKKITALKVNAPAVVKQGDIFTVGFAAVDGAGPQVFRVELIAPSGKTDPVCARNHHTLSSSGSCQVQIPFNGEKGLWTLAVKHVNTGLKKNIRIEVK